MVYKALSASAKKRKITQLCDEQVQLALEAYRQDMLEPPAKRKGLRKIAREFGVDRMTLTRLYKGGTSMSEFNIELNRLKQKLTAAEEQIINWVDHFLERNRNQLQTHWSRPLDTVRVRALNPTIVKHWFELVKVHVVDMDIRPGDTYGMDESGFPPNVTALVTICADGTTLRPMIIYKGHNFMSKWGDSNIAEASIAHSPNGWTDSKLAIEWIVNDFDPQTKEKAAGRTRVLLLDGHSSHYSTELLDFAAANNIVVLGYPPHCTHALQGLDEDIHKFEETHRRSVTKGDFTKVFGTAFLCAFTRESILAAFRATGIHPFNPDIIRPAQTKPSEATSVKGGFPLRHTAPVMVVMAAFHCQPYEDADANTDQPHTPGTEINPLSFTPSKRICLMRSALEKTSRSFLVSESPLLSTETIDSPVLEGPPTLPTPDWSLLDNNPVHQSRMDLETRNKELTESLRRAKDQLAAHNLIIEGSHAQLVVQNLYLAKLNKALHSSEQRKDDRTRLFPDGKGRHLTASGFRSLKRAQEKKRKDRLEAQRKGAIYHEEKRAAKEEAEAAWKVICEEHKEAIRAWDIERARLIAQGVMKKNLPRKPLRARKPKPATVRMPSVLAEVGDGDDSDGETVV
ncbi:hypothetical protein BOTBODRAFT_117181 [Botryobasidium botryosum FD-172 SS1]|uniref:DDE-1 domain-containing protein n=1 Tax=Botryobasidium botryosum (strain FD-172 SS1) TaxID=930990 RepID=A0A067M1J5_BOTB1|nr:hypothetical protein BOTBODRAFT_117181 [Botryobasidium botryosum FD-172 SS1]